MQYKEIDRIKHGLRKIGYSIFNKNTGQAMTSGKHNALVVRSKVKDFEYKKGFTPSEIAFEDVIFIMLNYGACYGFDTDSLALFLKYMKEDFPEEYKEMLFEKLEGTKLEEGKVVVIGGDEPFNPQLN